jgi:type I restriction enzyme R subunit
MYIPSFKEDHISQVPALQMLVNLGYTYLTSADADRQRGGKTSAILLEYVFISSLKSRSCVRL